MLYSHLLLGIYWVCFCALHSFLASPVVKYKVTQYFNLSQRSYRIAYNIAAVCTLAYVLYWQINIPSISIFTTGFFTTFTGLMLMICGFSMMWFSIRKYFAAMSGLYKNVSQELELTGLHRFVRHPLYLGTILFSMSFFLFWPQWKNLLAIALLILYTFIGIVLEEKKLIAEFGEKYTNYQKNVPMLLPRWNKTKK